MKILMVAPEPVFEPRGTPFSVIYRIKALSELGHEVDLLTYHIGSDIDIKNLNICRIPRIPFCRSIKIGPSVKKIFLDIFLFIKTVIYLIKNRYDAVHSHEEAAFWCVLPAKIFRIPHVYDMHSSLPQQLSNFGFLNFFPFRNIFRGLEAFVIRNSRSVITICNDLYDTARNIDSKANIVNIENIFDNSAIFQEDASELERYREHFENRIVVLYYGTMEKYQGIDLLIRSFNLAAEKNRSLLLLMIGGRDDQILHYSSMVKHKDSTLFIRPVSPGQLKPFTDRADMLITARTRGTNTPLKLYGYIRAGKPIIATDIYSHTQVLNNDIALLCKPEASAVADAISRAAGDSLLRNTLSDNCLKYAEDRYSNENYIKKVKEAYSYITG